MFAFLRVFGSDADVSPVIGIQAPCLPSCVCFGSDADVSPVIGIQAPRLPLPVFVCVRVSRATNALILLSSEEIRMHRMRHPSEHIPPVPNYVDSDVCA